MNQKPLPNDFMRKTNQFLIPVLRNANKCNEPALTVVSLNALLTTLQTHNNNMGANAIVPMEQTRIARDHMLYDAETGLVDIALQVKAYVISVFGVTAPETKTVTGIKFTRPQKQP